MPITLSEARVEELRVAEERLANVERYASMMATSISVDRRVLAEDVLRLVKGQSID